MGIRRLTFLVLMHPALRNQPQEPFSYSLETIRSREIRRQQFSASENPWFPLGSTKQSLFLLWRLPAHSLSSPARPVSAGGSAHHNGRIPAPEGSGGGFDRNPKAAERMERARRLDRHSCSEAARSVATWELARAPTPCSSSQCRAIRAD
jgi:hypothetical protein